MRQRQNLKKIANDLQNANPEHINFLIRNICSGNYDERDYNIIWRKINPAGKNFGTNGFNLIAYIGQRIIYQFFYDLQELHLNQSQILKIYNYLSEDFKLWFKRRIIDELESFWYNHFSSYGLKLKYDKDIKKFLLFYKGEKIKEFKSVNLAISEYLNLEHILMIKQQQA